VAHWDWRTDDRVCVISQQKTCHTTFDFDFLKRIILFSMRSPFGQSARNRLTNSARNSRNNGSDDLALVGIAPLL
jgi:hypothetical protein